MSKNYLKLFACCLIVKGVKRATIVDVQRQKYIFVPLQIAEILESNEPFPAIIETYDPQARIELLKYADYFVNSEWAFYTSEPESFPRLTTEWKSPHEITNAIIDVNNESSFDMKSIITQLEDLGCQAILFRLYTEFSFEFIQSFLDFIQMGAGVIRDIQLILHFSASISRSQLNYLSKRYSRISSITIHNAPTTENWGQTGRLNKISFIKQLIADESHCGYVHPNYFKMNIYSFTEALHYNSCLNRKISIDVRGNIKNCPAMHTIHGNLATTTIAEVLDLEDYKMLGKINKDQIDICKVCEFRYICADCRAFTSTPDDLLSKPLKCRYDPYTMVWN